MVSYRAGAVAALLLVALAGGQAAGAVAGGPVLDGGVATGRTPSPALVNLHAVPETDNTVTRIVVHPNGSATWELRIRTRLESDTEASEYRAFQARFRENSSRFVGDFRESITGIVANARAVTGREMAATGFGATTTVQTVPRRWGVVAYEFRWDGFAEVDGERLVVGDAFQGGLFIAEGDALEVVGPEGYLVESAAPEPDESGGRSVSWQGREDFADRRPGVVFAPEGAAGAGGLPTGTLLGGVALLATAAFAAVGYRRWRGAGRPGPARGGDWGSATGADTAEELLADEDYVRRALVEHGGRMRQSEVKDALDWSRSKTSRVLGRMEEAGTIRKLQLGRENVIDLADGEDGT